MASNLMSDMPNLDIFIEEDEEEEISHVHEEDHSRIKSVYKKVVSIVKKPLISTAQAVMDTEKGKHAVLDAAATIIPSIKPYTHLLEYLKFTEAEEPYSTRADEMGLHIGAFLVEHANFIEVLEATRREMEKESHLPIRITYFKNWASNLHESNGLLLYSKPKSVDQVQRVIRAAKKLNVKVGCGGSYHSWSPLFPDKCSSDQLSLIINNRGITLQSQSIASKIGFTDKKRIILNEDMTVTIVPGVTTGELMEVFLENGLCFESDVVLMGVTYGGVMTTGCHGVGEDQTALADWITQIKIVDHNGDLKTFPDDAQEVLSGSQISPEDLMNAVKVSMGVLGIVVEMTVKVKKMITARLDTSYPTIGSLLYGEKPTLLPIIRNNWSVEILWFPYNSLGIVAGLLEGIPLVNIWQPKTDQVWVRAINKDTVYVEANKIDKMTQKISDTLQHKAFAQVGSPILSHYGNLTPAVIGSGFKLVKETHKEGTTYEPMPFALHFRYGVSLAPAYDMEFAFPFTLNDDEHCFDTVFEAMRIVVEKCKEYAIGGVFGLEKEFPLSTTMELRVIRKSHTLLCPATKRPGDETTHTAYLEILSFGGTKNYQKFFTEVGKKWMSLGGVPHWCKQWTFLEDSGIIGHIHKFYGENLVKFREVLKLLNKEDEGDGWCDIFVNSSMMTILDLK